MVSEILYSGRIPDRCGLISDPDSCCGYNPEENGRISDSIFYCGYNPEENERISDSTLQEIICRSVIQTTSGQIRIDFEPEIFARIEIG